MENHQAFKQANNIQMHSIDLKQFNSESRRKTKHNMMFMVKN